MSTITQQRLREVARYDGTSGLFFWLVQPPYGRRRDLRKPAGTLDSKGYFQMRIDRVKYFVHRLAWLYVYGNPVPREIDHRDGDPRNNRIANLRETTRSTNLANSRKIRAGLKGARRNGTYWKAEITVRGERIYLGAFRSEQAAHDAYMEAARKYFGEFARAA